MPRVTALRSRGARVLVELDGAPWRAVPAEVALRAGLAPDLDLDRPRLRVLARELRRHRALSVAARAVRGRDLSRERLVERLARNGVAPAAQAETVELLERAGIVDDDRVAHARAQALAGRGFGDAAIRDDLERLSVPAEAITAALALLEPERERASRAAARAGDVQRAARLLARKGFDPGTIASLLDLDVADTA